MTRHAIPALLLALVFIGLPGGQLQAQEAETNGGTALPLAPPPGVDGLLADFIEVCSLALVDLPKAAAEAAKRGWTSDKSTAETFADMARGLLGMRNEANGYYLFARDIRFPHADTGSCQMQNVSRGDEPLAELPVAALDFVEGALEAEISGYQGVTLHSLEDDAGGVVSIVTSRENGFQSLVMSRFERLEPAR